ncbi:MAG TPA: ABC transporter substrate-binding protein [Acidimicrobiales bacterium]|nr:ABC transporter substrate-binding protein [Acidimicrobiales bacterium]
MSAGPNASGPNEADRDAWGSRRYDRRDLLGIGARAVGGAVLLGGAPALLAACSGGSGGSSAANAGGSSTTTAGKPRYGGTLTVGISAETNGLNPAASDFTSPAVYYARAVFDTLTVQASDGTVKPYLAQAVTPNASYDVWTITLRPGVVFHDGTPLDADALVTYFDQVIASPTYSITLQKLIKSVTKTGDLTVALNMGQPWVAFDAYLSGGTGGAAQMGFIPSPKMLTDPNGANHPVGTGPFVFSHWDSNVQFVVTRNPHYWRAGLPYLDGITFKPIPDETARWQTLQAGGVQLIHSGDYGIINTLMGQSRYAVLSNLHGDVGEPSQNFVMLNTQVAPLDDLRVRQALAYATDQKKLIQLTEFNLVSPSSGPFEPGNPWYAPTGYPSYDPAKAQALVKAYEADKGPISFPILTAGTSNLNQLQALQSMWKQVGITVSAIKSETSTAQIGDILVGRYSAASWGQFSAPDPDMNYPFWSPTTVAPLGTFAVNFARNADPRIEAALQIGRTNPDNAARVKAYQDVAGLLAADVPYIWTGRAVGAVAVSSNVKNYDVGLGLPGGGRASALNGSNVWLTEAWVV